jgi:uncharacterized protein (DUF433 family)
MDWRALISTNPDVCHGKACFTGTRVMVSVVLDNLAAGVTHERILRNYPSLRNSHISAALAYAADLARDRIVPLAPSKVA